MEPNFQVRNEPNAQRAALRLEAEQVAYASANGAWAAYHKDERRYTSVQIAETFEKARTFLAAAVALPASDDSMAERRSFIAAALASLCDGVHMEQRQSGNEPVAPEIAKTKNALLKLLTALADGMPRGFGFLARSVLRPVQDANARQRMLAHLRHAVSCLVIFGSVTHDAPTDRL